jgi:hypothetical protein
LAGLAGLAAGRAQASQGLLGVTFAARTAGGAPLSQVNPGETYYVDVYVQDLRPANPQERRGVISFYADLTWPADNGPGGDMIDVQSLKLGPDFTQNRQVSFTDAAGLAADVGGTSLRPGVLGQTASPQLWMTLQMRAERAGRATLASALADNASGLLADASLTLYSYNEIVRGSEVSFGRLAVDIRGTLARVPAPVGVKPVVGEVAAAWSSGNLTPGSAQQRARTSDAVFADLGAGDLSTALSPQPARRTAGPRTEALAEFLSELAQQVSDAGRVLGLQPFLHQFPQHGSPGFETGAR